MVWQPAQIFLNIACPDCVPIAQARVHRRIGAHLTDLIAPFRVHLADRQSDAIDVAQHVVALPFAGDVVAEHDLVAVFAETLLRSPSRS